MLDPNKFTSQTRIGRFLRLPLKLVPAGLNLPVRSGPNKGLRWRTGSSVHGCWLGTYERDKVELLRQFVKPGMVAYDIGANAGYYTLLLSQLVGPTGRVFSFEPFPENLQNLTHHVAINRLSNCEVVACAVSDRAGLAGFRAGASNSMGSLVTGDAQLRVPTVSLDDLSDGLGIPPPDFVKMDVEGAEGLVLAGAKKLLEHRGCVWFVALHGSGPAEATFGRLRDAGYVIRNLNGDKVNETSTPLLDEIYAVKEPAR